MKKRSSMVMISSVPDKRESFLAEGEVCFVEFKACSQEGSCFKYILKTEKSEVLHMIFLTEYDEKKHLRHTFEEGVQKGRNAKLLELVQIKLSKGKSPEQIAEELEEGIDTILELTVQQSPQQADREPK